MAQKDKDVKKAGISRRDFLKASAATAAVGTVGLDFAAHPSKAAAATVAETYHTTCPYCSASCGQLIDVDASGNVLDVYGDHRSPFSSGGLCAKGAGAYQLVTNPRRVGAWAGAHPVDSAFSYNAALTDGAAYKRIGNGSWTQMDLGTAMTEIVSGDGANHTGLLGARGVVDAANGYNSKKVAFLGSSHLNNEPNYLYRKLIANFGTSNTEHQARI